MHGEHFEVHVSKLLLTNHYFLWTRKSLTLLTDVNLSKWKLIAFKLCRGSKYLSRTVYYISLYVKAKPHNSSCSRNLSD